MRVGVMARVIVARMVMGGTGRVRIAQDDVKAPIDRREHEACGNERAKAEHREHERRGPMARATVSQPGPSLPLHPAKMR
jgi:hypothetical protein